MKLFFKILILVCVFGGDVNMVPRDSGVGILGGGELPNMGAGN